MSNPSSVHGKGLNGQYLKDTDLRPMSPAKACLTGLAMVLSRENKNPTDRLALQSQLDGLWLGIGPQFRSIPQGKRQEIADGFIRAFVHAYGGDKEQAIAEGMNERPTLVSMQKRFGIGIEGHVGKHSSQIGADIVKLADVVAKNGLSTIVEGKGIDTPFK